MIQAKGVDRSYHTQTQFIVMCFDVPTLLVAAVGITLNYSHSIHHTHMYVCSRVLPSQQIQFILETCAVFSSDQ